MNDALLNQTQAAARLGLAPRTLAAYRFKGGGPRYIRISARCVRYRPADLDAWVADRVHADTGKVAD